MGKDTACAGDGKELEDAGPWVGSPRRRDELRQVVERCAHRGHDGEEECGIPKLPAARQTCRGDEEENARERREGMVLRDPGRPKALASSCVDDVLDSERSDGEGEYETTERAERSHSLLPIECGYQLMENLCITLEASEFVPERNWYTSAS